MIPTIPILSAVTVHIQAGAIRLEGQLTAPEDARGFVIVASADGDHTYERANAYLAGWLADAGFATLLISLLTPDEEAEDAETSALRFNQSLVASRLAKVTCSVRSRWPFVGMDIGYVAGGLCAGSALAAAAVLPTVSAVVCRGARLEVAERILHRVTAEVLLLVGEYDTSHLSADRRALANLPDSARLEVVPGAGHLLEDPDDLEYVARSAEAWFARTLTCAVRREEEMLVGA
jgi:putative phosphoribosyl transferase